MYQLIWRRFIASRMQPAKYETTSIKIEGKGHWFLQLPPGFCLKVLSVYQQEDTEDTIKASYETLNEGDILKLRT